MNITSQFSEVGRQHEVIYTAVDNHLAVVPSDIASARAALTS